MSFGFLAVNNNNQVLVSSDTRNLHLIAKLTSPAETIYTSQNYGGMRKWRYRVNSAVTPMPFFTMPTADYYGITRILQVATNVWDIEVIRSGTGDSVPEVYVFADPRAVSSADTYGMVIYRDDGSPAFDSRLRPLVIYGGITVTHSGNPRDSFPYGLSSDNCGSGEASSGGIFAPNTYNGYGFDQNAPVKPIYFFSSLAQAEREAHYHRSHRSCTGFDAYGGCVGYGTEENWNSWYWAFYRGGICSPSRNELRAGWVVSNFGCNYSYSKDNSFVGIGVGGGGGSGGSWPYSNKSLNISNNVVIMSDGAKYD